MYHIALINRAQRLIECAEALELEFSAKCSARLLSYEAEASGDGWEVYGPADKPFAFPTAEEEEAAAKEQARVALLCEVAALDKALPRHVEDLYEITGKYPPGIDPVKAAEAKARKLVIRKELA